MRYTGEMRLQTFGDQVRAHEYIPFAREMAFNLQRQMKIGDLKVLGDYKVIDGVEVTVRVRHNLVEAVINAPEKKQQEIILPAVSVPEPIITASYRHPCYLPRADGFFFSELVDIPFYNMQNVTPQFTYEYFGQTLPWWYGYNPRYDFNVSNFVTVDGYESDYMRLNLSGSLTMYFKSVNPLYNYINAGPYLTFNALYAREIYNLCDGDTYSTVAEMVTGAPQLYLYEGDIIMPNQLYKRRGVIATYYHMSYPLWSAYRDACVSGGGYQWVEYVSASGAPMVSSFQVAILESQVTNIRSGAVTECDLAIGFSYKELGYHGGDGDMPSYDEWDGSAGSQWLYVYDPASARAVVNINFSPSIVNYKDNELPAIKTSLANRSFWHYYDRYTGDLVTDKLATDWVAS